jgi:putative PIN family toxin of toxin-antitoxin system
MKADRLVLDTNVLISALLSPGGEPRRLVEHLAVRSAILLFSNDTFRELAVRLAKPKFDRYRTREQMEQWLDWLSELAEWVHPPDDVKACRDPDDNGFLAVALYGEADAIVTGNQGLLVLHPFEGIPILTPADAHAQSNNAISDNTSDG